MQQPLKSKLNLQYPESQLTKIKLRLKLNSVKVLCSVKMNFVILLLISCFASANAYNIQSCTSSPETDQYKVVDDGQSFTLTCSFDDKTDSCSWKHNEPMNEDLYDLDTYDIECTFSTSESDTCHQTPRITGSKSERQCSITVTNSEPEDSGKWKLIAFSTSHGTAASARNTFDVWTYNVSTVEIQDENHGTTRNFDIKYNWNEKEEEWEEGESNWARAEFFCLAQGGRPNPNIKWYIDDDSNDLEGEDVFDISDTVSVRTYDRNGFIRDFESKIEFEVNAEFMEKLDSYRIDTNPEDGEVTFELFCQVEQDYFGSSQGLSGQQESIRINVEKSYDDGKLKTVTINIIIGVVVGVFLFILILIILVFAKANGCLCFGPEDYDYRNPRDPKSRPPTQSGGQQQSQQVYSVDFSPAVIPGETAVTRTTTTTTTQVNRSPEYTNSRLSSTSFSDGEHGSATTAAVSRPSPRHQQQRNHDKLITSGHHQNHSNSTFKHSPNNTGMMMSSSERSNSTTDTGSNRSQQSPTNTIHNQYTTQPPPRPYKPKELQPLERGGTNKQRLSFMQDPKNKVLPPSSSVSPVGSLRQVSTTNHTSIVSTSKIV